jgi:hypothetical protein
VAGQDDRWKVDGAIGVSVSVPSERMAEVGELLTAGLDSPVSLAFRGVYFTTAHGTVNGQPIEHTKITLMGDQPSDTPPIPFHLPGVVGSSDDPGAGLMWKHGYTRIEGDIRIAEDGTAVEVTTKGGQLSAVAVFDGETETWSRTAELRPNLESPSGHIGPEGATRTHGTGKVIIRPNDGPPSEFDTYVGLDTDLFWDYTFPAPTGAA